MKRACSSLSLASGALGIALLFAPVATRAAVNEATNVPLFSISKTENRNYVQFAERLDSTCAPLGDAPVNAYWRMLERDPSAIEPLLPREQPAYGVLSQSVVERSDGRGVVRVLLRALRAAPLLVESHRGASGNCEASALTPIAGVDARLFNVHAVLRWPFGIAHLLVSGWSIADGRTVRDTRGL